MKWAIVLVVACILGGGYLLARSNKGNDRPGDTAVNLESAADADKREAEQNKERLAKTKDGSDTTSNNNPASSNQKKSVKPTVTEATRTSVRAYVSGIFEEGGTCTATFTKGSETLTKTSAGFGNASYTQCTPINFDSSFLSAGKWSVALTYSSASSEGVSDARYIE